MYTGKKPEVAKQRTPLRSSAVGQWWIPDDRSGSRRWPQQPWTWSAWSGNSQWEFLYGRGLLRFRRKQGTSYQTEIVHITHMHACTRRDCISLTRTQQRPLTLAVHGHSTAGALAHVQKASGDEVRWCAPVQEEKVVVLKASVLETPGIIQLPVESDHRGDLVLSEVRKVELGGVQGVTCNHK